MNDDSRDAARFLIANPLVTAARHPEEHRRIRRHADELTTMFRTYLGYRLAIDARLARLYKAGLGRAGTREISLRKSRLRLSPRDYTYLALVCSVLLNVGQQLLLSSLVADVEQAAAEAGIAMSQESRSERFALVHAIKLLIDWGALVEEDGSVSGYGDKQSSQALLTIERDVVREIIATPLRDVPSPAELVRIAAEVAPEAIRHGVRRRLVECPVVMLDELDEPERLWLRQSQRREASLLEENLGLSLEIRAEGVAAFDARYELSDVFFPRDGTAAQAALLAVSQLVDEALMVRENGVARVGGLASEVPVAPGAIPRVTEELFARHSKSWSKEYAGRPERLASEVEELLIAMGLVRRCEGGQLALRAVAARYAPEAHHEFRKSPPAAASVTCPQAFTLALEPT